MAFGPLSCFAHLSGNLHLTLNRIHAEWVLIAFFMSLAGTVFQQIHTDLAEQDIASGDAFHNAAFYPQTVAILILGTVFIRAVLLTIEMRNLEAEIPSRQVSQLVRPAQILILFGLYLFLVGSLGYHLATAPFIAMVMIICGDRKPVPTLIFSLAVAFLIAFLFEKYLKIVLPGGQFSMNIPW